MNKQCPSCKTPYNIGDADLGRSFTCFKCNAALVVQKDGLRLANATTPAPVVEERDAEAAPAERKPARGGWGGISRFADRLPDLATGFFGIGAFLVIIFLFFPIINYAKVSRAKASIDAGQLREDRLERELKQKVEQGKSVSPADEELRKKARQSWEKEKTSLQADAEELTVDAKRSDYWYTWGMMLGFLFLAAAALGYLNPGQPGIRRVVGAIVIVSEVLLIFLKYLFRAGLS